MSAGRLSIVAALAMLTAAALSAAPDPALARRDADSFKTKISAIARRGDPQGPAGAARTTVTQSEVNHYLALDAAPALPTGVVSPEVVMLGGGRASGKAVVDLDRVRRGIGATGVLNPLSYLRGRLPVVATGAVQSRDGVARLHLESATVGGVPIPKVVLQQIVTHYSRSERFPSGIDLDDPFVLPARIREIQVEQGRAIVVQ